MRIYVAVDKHQLAALADGQAVSASAFVAASDEEEDELAALEEAAENGAAVAVAEVGDPDGPITLAQVEALHIDLDGTGDLAWHATQEIDAVLAHLS